MSGRAEDDEAYDSGRHAWDERQDAADGARDCEIRAEPGGDLCGGSGAGHDGVDDEDFEGAVLGVSGVAGK